MPRRPAIKSQIDIDLGARIRERRKSLGMSQSALADALGITFQQVQKYEKGSNRVGSSRVQQIAQILATTPGVLFGEGLGQPDIAARDASPLGQPFGSSDGLALNRAFIAIQDASVRRSVIALVKALAEHDSSRD